MSYARCPGACRHGHGDACLAARTGHWRICELADPAHPDHDPAILAQLSPDAPPAPIDPIDPIALAIDLCPSRRSCSCSPTIDCKTRGWVDKVAVCRPCPDKNRP